MKKFVFISILSSLLLSSCSIDKIANLDQRFANNHWAEPYIENLIEEGIMSGYPDGKFFPDNSITREEAATLLFNLSGNTKPLNSHFSDVIDTQNWSYDAINSIYEQGYISGFPDGTFKPHENMSREEFSSLIYNYLNENGYILPNNIKEFSDTNESWAKDSIGILANSRILSGYDDDTFLPQKAITRGETAKVISEILSITASKNKNEESDIFQALNKGFSAFKYIYYFTYPSVTTPQDIVDVYKEDFRGTYFEGIIDSCSVEVRTSGNTSLVGLKTKYLHSREDEKELTSFIDSTAESIKNEYQTDYDRAKAAHDFVVRNAKYNEGNKSSLNTVGVNVHSPYSIMTDGHGVCQSYALLNHRLLEAVGLKAIYVVGTASNSDYTGSHAWNLVQLDDNWYHIDTTWDDPIPDIFNRVKYDYFLLSDDQISDDHSWDINNYPKATTPYK